MKFHSKHGRIPDRCLDNEVPVKQNPDDCYSPDFVARQKQRLGKLLKALQKRREWG